MDLAWSPASGAWTVPSDDIGPAESAGRTFVPGSPSFLSAALNGARIGTWQFDPSSGDWSYDDTTADIFGILPGQGGAWASVIAEDYEAVMAALTNCLETRRATDLELRVSNSAGASWWVHVLAQAVELPDGGGPCLAGISMDVTARKHAEAAVRESERQLRAMIDNLPGIAYRCSLEPPWNMSFISDGVELLTGYGVEDFLLCGLSWEELVFGEDLPRVRETVERAVADRTRYSLEYRIVHRSGAIRWIQEKGGAAYDEAGTPMFLEGFIGDIHDRKLAEEKRNLAEERNRLISLAVTDGVWELDTRTNCLTVNEAFGTAFGYGHGEVGLDGRWWFDQVHPDDRERLLGELYTVLTQGGTRYLSEHRFRRADGSYAEVYACCYVMRDESGSPVRMLGALQDLTARKLADAALRESEATNRSIVEASTDCVKIVDLEGTLQFINANGAAMMELEDSATVVGRPWESILPEQVRPDVRKALKTAAGGEVARFTALAPTRTGQPKWWDVVVSPVFSASGTVKRLVAISRDITEARQAEEQLLRAATRDPLTRLANRTSFQDRLTELVSGAGEDGQVGLMLLDLDDFKQINDTLGHDAGDVLLETIAARLLETCRSSALVARLGGDEFAMIYKQCGGSEELAGTAARILDELRKPIVHEGRILDCHATIGAAIYPRDGQTPEDLLKSADLALYAAKASRRGGFVAFEPLHRSEMEERLGMIRDARSAVRDRKIMPYYQPKIELDTGAITGFEALLRWRGQDCTIHRPGSIAAAFDDLDLAAAISDGMIEQVIDDMRRWLDRGIEFGHVAINAAAAEFRSGEFAECLLARLDRAGVPPSRVQVEVTETVFLGRGAEYVERALRMLSEAGASIALDDFGTGYASLRHLKQFPVHVIKIDRSFVRDMSSDADDAAIIEAVLNLGRSLDVTVIAEGIENENQENHLRALGCHFGQGFLYSEAVPAEEVPALIADWAPFSRPGLVRMGALSRPLQRELAGLRRSLDGGLRRAG